MGVTAAQIARVRALVAEPTTATYTDEAIETFIESKAIPDVNGNPQYLWDPGTVPATQTLNPDWVETYDLYAAAAEIWDEKAAAVSADYNYSGDGVQLNREKRFENFRRMAAMCRSKRVVLGVAAGPWKPNTLDGVKVINQA